MKVSPTSHPAVLAVFRSYCLRYGMIPSRFIVYNSSRSGITQQELLLGTFHLLAIASPPPARPHAHATAGGWSAYIGHNGKKLSVSQHTLNGASNYPRLSLSCISRSKVSRQSCQHLLHVLYGRRAQKTTTPPLYHNSCSSSII